MSRDCERRKSYLYNLLGAQLPAQSEVDLGMMLSNLAGTEQSQLVGEYHSMVIMASYVSAA